MIYDDVIMRTIVDLPDEQVKALAAFCRAEGISRAEAVRRALTRLVDDQKGAQKEDSFGAWKERRFDSRRYVEELRREWGE
ncbi:MAG TPA: CopG family transcriptional regulator [Chthoniobacterales bacterium]